MYILISHQFREHGAGNELLPSGDWDCHSQQMFLVCVFNVSEDQPYTILQAPCSSTAQDIITQVNGFTITTWCMHILFIIQGDKAEWLMLCSEEDTMHKSIFVGFRFWFTENASDPSQIYHLSSNIQSSWHLSCLIVTCASPEILFDCLQAMMKSRRPDEPQDPRHYVLLEELYLTVNFDPKRKHNANKLEKRILADDENVYEAQKSWRSNAGKLLLLSRHRAAAVISSQVNPPVIMMSTDALWFVCCSCRWRGKERVVPMHWPSSISSSWPILRRRKTEEQRKMTQVWSKHLPLSEIPPLRCYVICL